MTPQSPAHAHCIRWLTGVLARKLGDEYAVAVQLPLTLGQRNEPEPDVAVVPAESTSKDHHPGTAVLAIEVSGVSLRKDRRVEAALYARFGVLEYWIVNLEAHVVEVSSDPDAANGAYRRTRTVSAVETLTAETLPELSLPVADLFG